VGFSDVAKAAFDKALEVYEGLSKLSAVVGQIDARLVDFRDETRKRLTDFEHRLENRANAIETRSDRKLDDAEKRIRELESRMAQLEGKAEGALAEAYKTLLVRAADGHALTKGQKAIDAESSD
jgi:hypothetical protein